MDAKICIWFVLCQGGKGFILELDLVSMHVGFEESGF